MTFKTALEKMKVKVPIYNIIIYMEQQKALNRLLKKKLNSKREPKKIKKPLNIVSNLAYSPYLVAIYREAGIMKTLQLLGHNVKMYICGGGLTNCVGCFNLKMPPNEKACKNCVAFGKEFLDIIDIPYETYVDALHGKLEYSLPKGVEKQYNMIYKGVRVGFHGYNSAERYFKGDVEAKGFRQVFYDRLQNACVAVDVAEHCYKKDKPDIFITSHGCYSEWGAFMDYLKNKDVRCIVWDSLYGDNFIFNEYEFDKMYKAWKKDHGNLTTKEEDEIKNFLELRHSGGTDTSVYNLEDRTEELKSLFPYHLYEKVYCMFCNVPWDTSLATSSKVFTDFYEWLDCTIAYFHLHKNKLLLIKVHPAEISDGSIKTVKDFINNHYKLPDNIKIIDANSGIKSIDLLPYVDVGIVNNGTVGLEMAVEGHPVIVVGKTYYAGKEITYDAENVGDYIDLLETHLKPTSDKAKSEALHLAYFRFLVNIHKRTYIKRSGFIMDDQEIEFNINKFEDFLENKELDRITKFIVGEREW